MRHLVSTSSTLLQFLKTIYPDSSVSSLKKWIEGGRIEVNNSILRLPHALLQEGDSVSLLEKVKRKEHPLSIVYDDPFFVVIDKKEGMLSVAADSSIEPSVHSYLKQIYPKVKIGVIHRLDRDTSGVIAFAKERESYLSLKEQLKNRTMKRRYIALVEGSLSGEGTWDCFLKEDSSYTVRCVPPECPGSERAITVWKTLGSSPHLSVIECTLVTGKKNQIRVQASSTGHPLLGDVKYGSSKKSSRLFLHAFSLECTHPKKHKKMIFFSPIPPAFFSHLPSSLRHELQKIQNECQQGKKIPC